MWQLSLGTCHGSHLPGTRYCILKLVELVYILFLLNNIYEQAVTLVPCPNTTQYRARRTSSPNSPNFSLLFLEVVRNSLQRGDGRNLYARAQPPSFSSCNSSRQPNTQPPVKPSFRASRRHGALPSVRRPSPVLLLISARPLLPYCRCSPSCRCSCPTFSPTFSGLILHHAPTVSSRLQY